MILIRSFSRPLEVSLVNPFRYVGNRIMSHKVPFFASAVHDGFETTKLPSDASDSEDESCSDLTDDDDEPPPSKKAKNQVCSLTQHLC